MTDFAGLFAGALVLATFSMRSMFWLRLTALASNIAFIYYGVVADLMPVWSLHAILLPLNGWYLAKSAFGRPIDCDQKR